MIDIFQALDLSNLSPKLDLPCQIIRWVDADTARCEVRIIGDVRLLGINAPEKRTEEGRKALAYVLEQFPLDTQYRLMIPLGGKLGDSFTFGRVLGSLYTESGAEVAERIIKAGHGKVRQ